MSWLHHRPTIIVTGPKKGFVSRFFIIFSLFLCGARTKIITPNKPYDDLEMDGLLISGGNDLYNAFIEDKTCKIEDVISYERDVLEYTLLNKAVENNKPVFGICRGYQLINIFFGGELCKDIRRDGYDYKYTPLPWKTISVTKGGILDTCLKTSNLKINTLHHQAVQKLPESFKLEAVDKYNIIQSISKKDDNNLIFGVQWHPEYLFYKKQHLKIFKIFVDTVKSKLKD
ncbi:gamma-glutamyl-gamma-aminobutyrate hydrolase family protein [Arcobacter sp. KX21116]|uniref:gamma-glutamyl-gamma-aminobutyrate hydrolase family protein n=1 Tax=Arcobacter iocasae TaxID=2906515 RepID=UPI0035D440B3